MRQLKENGGIPRSTILLMAVVAGITVANLYYNQPLLEKISEQLHIGHTAANLITVITQAGYAVGLLLIIPSGDLYSRRRIVLCSMLMAAAMSAVMGLSSDIRMLWGASLLLGASSVIPQLFIPLAGQFSEPENKARNMGYVLSGLLTGILAARVVSGFVGEWFGWRAMFFVASGLMVVCCGICLRLMPDTKRNFSGTYRQLMTSLWTIMRDHPQIRLNSVRGGFGFGSMLAIWSCLAFRLAGPPFYEGSDMVGILGLCGMAGAIAASGIGRYIARFGVRRFSVVGACVQLLGWLVSAVWGGSYAGLILALILVDIGNQCQQLSGQSDTISEIPEASNRANTLFMTTYFVGGCLGTFCAGVGWEQAGWGGVCMVGAAFALGSLAMSAMDGGRRRA